MTNQKIGDLLATRTSQTNAAPLIRSTAPRFSSSQAARNVREMALADKQPSRRNAIAKELAPDVWGKTTMPGKFSENCSPRQTNDELRATAATIEKNKRGSAEGRGAALHGCAGALGRRQSNRRPLPPSNKQGHRQNAIAGQLRT